MRVLLDECVPKRLCQLLIGHDCVTVPQAGWAGIRNGKLLELAESKFDAFLTVDKNLAFQTRIIDRNIAVLVIHSSSIEFDVLATFDEDILEALQNLEPGTVRQITKTKA